MSRRPDGYRITTDFAGLVLCYFVLGVFLASLALAVGATGLGNVDLEEEVSAFHSSMFVGF